MVLVTGDFQSIAKDGYWSKYHCDDLTLRVLNSVFCIKQSASHVRVSINANLLLFEIWHSQKACVIVRHILDCQDVWMIRFTIF